MKGRIWVDQVDFAIVRMEGKPAKNPSFGTRRVHFVRRYKKHGPFWLTDSLQSESVLWIAGKSTLDINYFDYEINFPDAGHDKPGRPGAPRARCIFPGTPIADRRTGVRRSGAVRLYRALLVVVGLVLLAGVVFWIGPAELLRQLVMLGWIFPVLLVFGLVKHALRTSAWKEALEAEGVAIEFRELFRIRIVAQALAYFSSMGGACR